MFVVDILTKNLEQRIDELQPDLSFIVLTGAIVFPIARESLYEIDDFSRSAHLYVACRSCFHIVVSSL